MKGHTRIGILLAGDTGVGKTSFVRWFSRLLGMKLITIEAPHIVEEKIIQIPFIVFNPKQNTATTHVQAAEVDEHADYKIVLADSYLFNQIRTAVIMSDADLLKFINQPGNSDMLKIYEELGGGANRIPDAIRSVREQYKIILFLDEYFRQTSPRIRNMLRNILNGKIGTQDIPNHTYVMFASNMEDEGLEPPNLNNAFMQYEVATPNKDEWFNYLLNKFSQDEHVKLNMDIINKFYELLADEDLNIRDVTKEVRVSPRRWEQLLLYINAALPAKNEREAQALLTNVQLNFKSQTTGETANVADKVMKAVAELIEATSNIKVKPADSLEAHEWRETLRHQIEQKMKLGDSRAYIPTVSGQPGIGKTAEMFNLANSLNLRYVYIDCSTLDPEDSIGMPLSKTAKSGAISTSFSVPKLFKFINDEIKRQDETYLASVNESEKRRYAAQKFKYLIFFDELNRVGSIKTFNALRQVLLEKKFGDDYSLPKEAIVVAAINPYDHAGIQQFTGHMKDAIDIIDAAPSWAATKRFIDAALTADKFKNSNVVQTVETALQAFINKFKTKGSSFKTDMQPFYLNIAASPVYVAPRDYMGLASYAAELLDMKLTRLIAKHDMTKLTQEEALAAERDMREALYQAFEMTLKSAFSNNHVNNPEFLHTLRTWFMKSNDIGIGENIFYVKPKTSSLESILKQYVDNPNLKLEHDADFASYVETVTPIKFKEDITSFVIDLTKKEEDIIEKIVKKNYTARVFNEKKKAVEELNKKVSLIMHLAMDMIVAIKVLDLSHDRIEHLVDAIINAFSAIATGDKITKTELFNPIIDVAINLKNISKGNIENLKL
jgi:MoxR-like ATPase